MVELIVVAFFDYTFLGVVIVAIAVAILVVWINLHQDTKLNWRLVWSKAKSQVDSSDWVVEESLEMGHEGPDQVDNLATYETTIKMPSTGQHAGFWWVDVCDPSRQRCEAATKGMEPRAGV